MLRGIQIIKEYPVCGSERLLTSRRNHDCNPNQFKTDKNLKFTSLEVHTNHPLNLSEHVVAQYLGLLQYLLQAEGENSCKDSIKY